MHVFLYKALLDNDKNYSLTDYLRQAGGYAPTGYEELDSGVAPPPRPEYLSPSGANAHPAAYGKILLFMHV